MADLFWFILPLIVTFAFATANPASAEAQPAPALAQRRLSPCR